jgi:hypothetical protein
VRKLVTANYGPVVAKSRGIEFAKRLGTTNAEGKFIPIIESPNLAAIYQTYVDSEFKQ